MHEIILAMKTDIIVATADKKSSYFTAYITFCDYIANSLKLHALQHAINIPNEGFTIQYMKAIIPNVS